MRIVKIIAACGLLFFVFFGSLPDNVNIKPVATETEKVLKLLQLEKPSDAILEKVKPVAGLVTSTEDRAKLALFNAEFASRIVRYDANCQHVNDLYTFAAKEFLNTSMNDKYEKLAASLEGLFVSVLGDENHILSVSEKESLSRVFRGLAWALLES